MSVSDMKDATVVLITKAPTFDQYWYILTQNGYLKAFITTFIVSFSVALIQTLVCALVAYGLAKFKFKGNTIIFGLVIMTLMIPQEALKNSMASYFRQITMVETRIKKANKVLKIITLSLIGIVLVFALVIGGFCLSGYKIIWVLGDSSVQAIKPFSLILVKPCQVQELVVKDEANGTLGDFAVRYSASGYVTHEVVEKFYDEETDTWYFDTRQAGDRFTETDGRGEYFTQKDLFGKVVAKESFIGKLLAWVKGYPDINTTLAGNASNTVAFIRILTLAAVLYGISKFADFISYKEDIY